MSEPLLEVRDLRTEFHTDDGVVKAVDGVSFTVEPGQVLGIVGESGSGKSVTCLTVMGLNDPKFSKSSGEVLFRGEDLLKASSSRLRDVRGNEIAMIFQDPMTSLNPVHKIGRQLAEAVKLHKDVSVKEAYARALELLKASSSRLRDVRGNEIAMIFQDPMTSLNPVHKIGRQLAEAILLHKDVSTKEAKARGLELLKAVGIPRAERRIDDYPHQFSGGMRQRVMIAMALVNDPDLIIADEPTTALDVTTQAQILALIKRLQEDFGSAVIMITHDLGVVAETADDVIVMYAARIAERGPVRSIFNEPRHPYTWGLMGSLPRLDVNVERLYQIPGQPPSLLNPPAGCRFHPRCAYAMPICRETVPPLEMAAGDPSHEQACHLDEETKRREAAALVSTLTAGAEA